MEDEYVRPIKIGHGKIAISSVNAAIMQILMILLTFFTLMTPRDVLGFKKVFLGLALLFGMSPIINGLGKNRKILMFAVVLPIIMYIMSTIVTGAPTQAVSYLYPFLYLLLIFPILKWDLNIEKMVLSVGNIMALFIIASCLLDYVGIMNIYSNPILTWLDTNGEAKISKSVYAMFRYVLFFNASPILFFNLMHHIKMNNRLYIVLTFVALLFTGTRANIYLGTAMLVSGMLALSKKFTPKVLIVTATLVVVYLFGSELLEKYELLANVKSAGDLTRVYGLSSILDAMNHNKLYWLTGMGFGTAYYNAGRLGMAVTSELSYFEFVREIGIPLSLLVIGYLIYPLYQLFKNNKFTFVAYGAYLVAGIVEPFIFTSTGFFVVMMVYAVVMLERYKRGYNIRS